MKQAPWRICAERMQMDTWMPRDERGAVRRGRKLTRYVTGDRIIVVVQKQRNFGPESGPGGASSSVGAANKVRRGDVRHAVVVRTRKESQRKDGSVVSFADNACVLINKSGEPIGSRLNGVVGAELRDKKWSKILSLAPMHL